MLSRGGCATLAGAMLIAVPAIAGDIRQQAVDSAYSELDWQWGCVVEDSAAEDEPGAWASLRCRGYRDYPVFVADDDQRMSVAYGFAGGPGRWESFASFNDLHDTVEWRVEASSDGRRPFATIHRWFVSAGQAEEQQVLVISTVARSRGDESCTVGYVDARANADANRLARDIADDLAPGFRCGIDEPRYHGATTAHSPQPVRARR